VTQIQPVRGTHDLLPEDYRRYAHVVSLARGVAERYGYAEMAPPIFEFTDVFARTMGETSDVVTKEMYSFDDRGGEGITLRPEFTAGIARAFISHGLYQSVPMKVFAMARRSVTSGRRRAANASSTSSTSRSSAPPNRAPTSRSSPSAPTSCGHSACSTARRCSSTPSATRRAARPTAASWSTT
jgi:hypothetical protein